MSLRTLWIGCCAISLTIVIPATYVPATAAPEYKVTRLASGKQIKVLGIRTVLYGAGKTKTLMLIYQTNRSINDKPGLAQEADDIWDLFIADAERSGLKSAIISANTEATLGSSNHGYNFLIQKASDGQWKCLNDNLVTKGTPAKVELRKAAQISAQKNYKEALVHYDRSIKLDPYYAQAYVVRGGIYALLHQSDKALCDLNKAISLNPDSGQAYNNRAAVYGETKQYQKAIDDCSKSIALNTIPTAAAIAYGNRGELYVKIGQYENAIDDLTKSIESNPQPAESYYYRSIAEEKLDKQDLAVVDRKKATELGYRENENTAVTQY